MDSKEWKIVFLNRKAEDEFHQLPSEMKAHYWHIVSLIKEFGPHNVGMPHIKLIVKKIWEIRVRGKDGIARVLYTTIVNRKLVILRVFIKKTQKTPDAEIRIALKRLKEVEE
ncbi:Phage-related protein [Rickettsiales bacterium Ac37b]|nr:Phage-related protein [Rickettsiales bacterium Ac37b]